MWIELSQMKELESVWLSGIVTGIETMMTENIPQCFDVEHAETLVFLKALEFARDFDITHFILEGDALCMVNKINSKLVDLSIIEHIINGIRVLIKNFLILKITM